MTLRERVLSDPRVYKTFKWLVLPGGALERLVADHFQVDAGGRVLDLGCGFGDYAPFFAGRADYLGIDHNESYIETARTMNAGSDARFLVADVADPVVAEHGPFDLVMISGVLHHLPPESITALAALIRPLLSQSGRLVAMEPVFDPDQRLSARLIIAADRGRYVRDAAGYQMLLGQSFSSVETKTVSGMLRMPYTHVFLTAAA